jgi:hypothetical protein
MKDLLRTVLRGGVPSGPWEHIPPRSGAKGTAHPGMVTAQIVAFSFKTSAA